MASEGTSRRRPHAGLLRHERRELLETRAELLRKLGSLLVEQYRRDDRHDEPLREGCTQVVAIDERVAEIDQLLETRRTGRLHGAR